MILKAKGLGILAIYETERKNGSQSSNLYSFNRFPASEPPKAKKLDHPKETNNLLKTNNQKINKRNEAPIELDHTFVSDKVPQAFVQSVKYFFSDAKTIEEYWHMVQVAAFRFECTQNTEDVLVIAIKSFPFYPLYRNLEGKRTGSFAESCYRIVYFRRIKKDSANTESIFVDHGHPTADY